MKQPPSELSSESLPLVHRHAAGLDIGSSEIWAAVPSDRDPQPVRKFGTFTPDLHALADWLQARGVTTVAMESTGVYWIPIFEILEARGLEVYLVNARQRKHVPGRKSDIQDCQWIQRLHSFGPLHASFRPAAEIVVLRAYLRQRAEWLAHRAAHIQPMQKALPLMSLQLPQVLKDITGVTGQQLIRAIVAGERNPVTLAQLRDPRCKHSSEEIAQALSGNCNTHSKNGPAYDARQLLYRQLGVDLVAIDGLNASSVLALIAELGNTLAAFPTVKQFCSWLHLAPHHDLSGGKVLRSRTLKAPNRAGQIFRMAAQSVGRTQTDYGAFFRKIRAKAGPKKAIVATAHTIARTFYFMLKRQTPYQATSAADFRQREPQRTLAQLAKNAKRLGFQLVPTTSPSNAT